MSTELKQFGIPEYPFRKPASLSSVHYQMPSGDPIVFRFAGPYNQAHEVTIAPPHNQYGVPILVLPKLTCEGLTLSLLELDILTIWATSGHSEKSLARVLGYSRGSGISQRLLSARERNATTIDGMLFFPSNNELLLRAERLGLLHPEFLPWIEETYLVKRGGNKQADKPA